MKLTAQIEYAYWALLDIAERYNPDTTVNLKEISERNSIPEKYLLQVMLKLKKQGMVKSRRGSGGGFMLTKAPEQILLSDVVEILGGSQNVVKSSFKDENRKHPSPKCKFFKVWETGQKAFMKEMKQHNLKTLMQQEKRIRAKNK